MDPSAVSFNSGGARRGGGGAQMLLFGGGGSANSNGFFRGASVTIRVPWASQIWMGLVVLETPIA
jgi:hypothetical protein